MARGMPIVIIVALLLLHAGLNAPPMQAEPALAPGAAHAGMPRYDAERIYADFSARDSRALAKYRQAPFVVSGRLQKIHAIGTTEIQLDLKAPNFDRPVRARLATLESGCRAGRCAKQVAVKLLPRGFDVYLQCAGIETYGNMPTLENCRLTEGPM